MAGSIGGCGSAYNSSGDLQGKQVRYKSEARGEAESIIGLNSRYAEDMDRISKLPKGEKLTVLGDIPGPEDSLFPTRTLMVQDSELHGYTVPACVADEVTKQK